MFLGASCDVLDGTFFKALFVVLLTFVDIGTSEFEQAIDETGQFAGRRDDSPGMTDAGTDASAVGTQGALAMKQALPTNTQAVAEAVFLFSCFAVENFTAADLVVRAEI